MNKLTILFLTLILILSFFLRFLNVTSSPPSLNWDEVAIGYNANSILQTGMDEWGEPYPLHFKSYGEYKLPAQIYASIPGIYLFGLTEIGVRITPIVYGVLTVLVLFFLTLKLFKSPTIALFASLLLAISPWHIQLTRASFESSFSVLWVSLGILFFVMGLERGKYFLLSALFFVVSVYTYNSARIFVPLFLLSLSIVYYKQLIKLKKYFFISLILFFVLVLPIILFFVQGKGLIRYGSVGITAEEGLVHRVSKVRGESTLPQPLPRLLYNKATFTSYYFASNYLSHFSPEFLFIKGASHVEHHVQGIGELYLIQAPFLLLGIFILLFKVRWLKLEDDKLKNYKKYRAILFLWLMLAFIPASLTNDSIPNALRTAIAIPTFQIITALGLVVVVELTRKNRILILTLSVALGISLIGSVMLFWNNLNYIYSYKYSKDWQYGYKQVISYVKENQDEYDMVIITSYYGQPYMFTLFYLNYPPQQFLELNSLIRTKENDFATVESFSKFHFPNLTTTGTRIEDMVKMFPGQKILFIAKSGDTPPELNVIKKIDFLNGDGAFEITESR